jgi:hypothetical protein
MPKYNIELTLNYSPSSKEETETYPSIDHLRVHVLIQRIMAELDKEVSSVVITMTKLPG